MPEEQRKQFQWMAKRLGFDHFIICGYNSSEFEKHVNSQGFYEGGTPIIVVDGSIAGVAYIIAQILCDFPFSLDLRRAVHSIINNFETGREIKRNVEKQTD